MTSYPKPGKEIHSTDGVIKYIHFMSDSKRTDRPHGGGDLGTEATMPGTIFVLHPGVFIPTAILIIIN
jgi:hypothetical protein